MRRALGLTAGLALVAVALSPIAPAEAACLTTAKKCQRDALITIDVAAKATPRVPQGGRVTYTLGYSMKWMESFAPYWGSFWVGGTFPKGARTPAKAALLDSAGRRIATLPCRRYADGVWCRVRGEIPHQGKVVLTARLARHGGGVALAKLGFDSFDGLNEQEFERRDGRLRSREKYCNFRFTRTVTTTVHP
ncbi:hypothetical protein [Streptosporangium carneum]|uniref:Uncharacterized protein n=1 Tax=Streptosporangium carneum TaxID=47481 RepID=A0A9W6I8I2_9ACTN|nr:hypothetical protein [Streptosporangium carneum]GLK13356.1 hypothetical protein GCM10017600_67670 [Streptosporangium carneum]